MSVEISPYVIERLRNRDGYGEPVVESNMKEVIADATGESSLGQVVQAISSTSQVYYEGFALYTI